MKKSLKKDVSIMNNGKENILGTEKIGKLIGIFAIPCIISMLVNSLYNIVDQIFIGWGVGMLGNGATNVVFPFSVIALAISLMFGDGASSYLSLKLGEKNKEEASKGVFNGLCGCAIVAIVFTILALLFLPQLLNFFGCTDELRSYATDYGRIITFGLFFVMLATSMGSIIRADGSPKYSMISMVLGAVLNIILDPILIFKFHMGVEGAAWATVISQFITFLINLFYLKKFKTVSLVKENRKWSWTVLKKVVFLGISSFITQICIVFVISISNNLLGKYGAGSQYGKEIPIAVLGIVMKVSQILNSIVLGLAIGAQPIYGYNYGAKKLDRVKQTLKIVLTISVIITTLALLLFQLIPDKLILLFGSGDANYIEFACLTFRIYLMLVICNGIQIPAGIFFQAIGKSSRSAVLSLSRQILFLLPAMIILSSIFGLMGVLYAGPVADGLSFLLSVCFLRQEIKNLNKWHSTIENEDDEEEIVNVSNRGVVITISREYGSGGRYVGRLVAEKMGIGFYDKKIVKQLSKELGFLEEYIENIEQKREDLDSFNNGYYAGLSNADVLYLKEAEIIKDLAKSSCVIVGRCADYVLKEKESVIKIFIYSRMEDKIKRATKYYGVSKKEASSVINKINKLRRKHYKFYTGDDWDDKSHYDLCINSDILGGEKTADLICDFIKEKINDKSDDC